MPEAEANTKTDKKWVVQNCVEVYTLLRDTDAIEYCSHSSVYVSVSVSVSVNIHKWNYASL